ncbi:hypothetical protein C8R45DRAFT_872101 [Mycena sanguinolenta]|nr:hypothetical protein C8R45DRAFT_872101 [Mycena sanguinolenta]
MIIFLPFFSDLLVLSFILLSRVTLSLGSVLPATIDDTNGDSLTGAQPVYTGSFSANSDCDGCTVHPDPSQAHDGTWHDSSQFNGAAPVSVTLSFNGIGIDVYCIIANAIPGSLTTTDLGFTLDGSPQKSYSHNPDSTSDYEYNVPVFSVSGLTQGAHQLVVATNNPDGSLFLFDYAEYSYEVTDPTTATDQVTNTVTQTAQVTATETQQVAVTQSSTTSLPNSNSNTNTNSSPSSHYEGSGTLSASSRSTGASSITASPSAIIQNASVSAPSSAAPAGTSSSSSLAPSVAASAKKFNHIYVLIGILILLLLLLLLAFLFWRRRRRNRETFIPDTESGHSGQMVFSFQNSTSQPGSHRTTIVSDADSAGWRPLNPQFNGSAAAMAVLMREKDPAAASDRVASPTNTSTPPPSAFLYTSEPPPMYSEQRPFPNIAPIP